MAGQKKTHYKEDDREIRKISLNWRASAEAQMAGR